MEGLATYVSKVLNPKANTDDILLPDELVRNTEQQMPKLAKELRENLDSTSTDTFMNFLSASPKRKDIPARVWLLRRDAGGARVKAETLSTGTSAAW